MIDKKASILAAILVSGFALASGAISLSSGGSSDVVNTVTVNATTVNSSTGNFAFIDAGTIRATQLDMNSNVTSINMANSSNRITWSGGVTLSGATGVTTNSAFSTSQSSGNTALDIQVEGARVECGPDTYFSESGTQCVASGDLTVTGRETHTIQALTCAAGAGACALTVTPSSSMITIDCQDVDTCDVTMSETGAVAGSRVCITIVGATGATDFADSAGVSELAGAFAAGIADTICMVYANSAWHEISRSNN